MTTRHEGLAQGQASCSPLKKVSCLPSPDSDPRRVTGSSFLLTGWESRRGAGGGLARTARSRGYLLPQGQAGSEVLPGPLWAAGTADPFHSTQGPAAQLGGVSVGSMGQGRSPLGLSLEVARAALQCS